MADQVTTLPLTQEPQANAQSEPLPTEDLELPSQPQEQQLLEKPEIKLVEQPEAQPDAKSEEAESEPKLEELPSTEESPKTEETEKHSTEESPKAEKPSTEESPKTEETEKPSTEEPESPTSEPEIPSEPTHKETEPKPDSKHEETEKLSTEESPKAEETEKPSTEESPKTESEEPSPEEPKKIYCGGLLTENQLLEAMYLATVYREFWASKKFREGWEQPVVDLKSVEHLLEEAAELVTELRGSHTNGTTPIDGSAKEYLWSLESLPKPDEFVRGLIHATLKHADGYVHDLDEATVDRQIAELILNNKANQDTSSGPHPLVEVLTKGRELESTIKGQWEEVSQLLKKSLEENPTQLWTSSLVSELSHISDAIKRVQAQIETFEARRNFKTQGGLSESCHLQAEAPKSNLRTSQTIPDEETQKGILKVELVRQKVTELNSEINTFEEGVKSDLTKVEELARKPIEAKTHINTMKKKAAVYLDSLCKDLDSLDAIQGDAVRSLRKAEVLHVQELINHVEKVQEQILRLETDLKPAVEKAEAEAAQAALKAEKEKRDVEEKARLEQQRKAQEVEKVLQARRQELQRQHAKLEEERKKSSLERQRREAEQQKALVEQCTAERAAEKARAESAVVPISKTVNVPLSSSDDDEDQVDWEAAWRKMKLEVDLNTRELEDSYIIVGNIPNMNKKDVKIKINEDKLEISGFRGPTEDEIAHLQRILQSRDLRGLPSRERTMALLRIGHGRFGTWSQVYQLPEDVVPDEILAEYTHGVLKVTLPKRRVLRRQHQPSRSARQQSFPYFDESPPSTRRSDPRSIYGQDPRFMYGGYPQQQQRRGNPGFSGFW